MRYKVYWKSQSQKDAVILECGNEEQAKAMFLVENEAFLSAGMKKAEPIIIEYDDKVIEKEYIEPVKTEQSSSKKQVHPAIVKGDQTQQEILTQLRQINWAIKGGFLFIILVVTGIIKPGIFG